MSGPARGSFGGGGRFGGSFTPTGRMIAYYYIGIFVAGLVVTGWARLPVVGQLLLQPLGGDFSAWQLVTHMAVYYPGNVTMFLLDVLMFWWFAWQIEQGMGRDNFVALMFGVPILAGVLGLPLTLYGPFAAPLAGFSLVIDVLVVAFALQNRRRVINLMMVFPLKAVHLIWAMIALRALYFLARENPWFHYQMLAMALTWVFFRFSHIWVPALERMKGGPGKVLHMEDRLKSKSGKQNPGDQGPPYH